LPWGNDQHGFFSWGSMECIWMELEKDQLKETRSFTLRWKSEIFFLELMQHALGKTLFTYYETHDIKGHLLLCSEIIEYEKIISLKLKIF